MIIGKSLTALGGGGLKPEIRVTAKTGALLNLHFKDSSIILQSYQLGAEETQHTFVVSVSETAYVVEDVTNGKSVEVLVDAVAQYSVEIEYKLWLYRDGNECTDVTGGWVGTESGYVYSPNMSVESGVKNSDSMFCKWESFKYKVLGTNNKVDLTGCSKIYFTVKMTESNLLNPWVATLIDEKDIADSNRFGESNGASASNVEETRICNISGISGEHYVVFACTSGDGGGYCYEIWAE